MALKAIPAGNGARSVSPHTPFIQGTGPLFAAGYQAPSFSVTAEDVSSFYAPVPTSNPLHTGHQKGYGPATTGNGWSADVLSYAAANPSYDGATVIPSSPTDKTAFPWFSINLNIADIWPSSTVFHARDTAHGGDGLDNLIDAALDYASAMNMVVWLHPVVGIGAPAWWQTAAVPGGGSMINGSGATYGNCPQTNSQSGGAGVDCPVWWHPEMYLSGGVYYTLMTKLAALYDSNPLFAGIVIAGPMTTFPEPMVRDLGGGGGTSGFPSTATQILAGDGGSMDPTTFALLKYGSFLKGPSANPIALTSAGGGELPGSFMSNTLTNPDGSGSATYPYSLYRDEHGGTCSANDVLAHYYALKCHKAIWASTRQQYACNPYAALMGAGTNVKYLDGTSGKFNAAQGNGSTSALTSGNGPFVFDGLGTTFDLARTARRIDGNVLLSNESARFVDIPGGPDGHEWEDDSTTGLMKIFNPNSYTGSPSQPGSKNLAYPMMYVGLRYLGAPYFQQTASASTDPTGDRIGAGVAAWLVGWMKCLMIETPQGYKTIWEGVLGTLRSNATNPNVSSFDPAHAYRSGDYTVGNDAIPYKISFAGGGTWTGNLQTPPVTDPSGDAKWNDFPSGILPIGGVWKKAGVAVPNIAPSHSYSTADRVVGVFNMPYQLKSGTYTTPAVLDDTDDPSQDTKHWKLATDCLISWTTVGGVYVDPVTGLAMGWYQPFPQSRSAEFSPFDYYTQTTAMQALPTTGSGSSPPTIPMPLVGGGSSASGTASLSLNGSGTATPPSSAGALTLSASGTARARATSSSATLTLAGAATGGTPPPPSGATVFTGVPGTSAARASYFWPARPFILQTSVSATATAALTLAATGTGKAPVTSSASLSLGASSSARAPVSSAAALGLLAAATATGPAAGTGAIALVASAAAAGQVSAPAAIALVAAGSGRAAVSAVAVMSLTAAASASGTLTSAASLDLAAAAAASGRASTTASISLVAAGTAGVPAAGTASLTLAATGNAVPSTLALAVLAIVATASVSVTASAAASMNLNGSGTAAGIAPATGTASLVLAAAAAGSAPVIVSAVLALSAAATPSAPITPNAFLALAAAATAVAWTSATATIDLNTGSDVSVPVLAAAALDLNGSGSPTAAITPTASLDLLLAASPAAPDSGGAELSLDASGEAAGISDVTGTASLELVMQISDPEIDISGSAFLALDASGSGAVPAVPNGASINLLAAAAASGSLAGSGAFLTLLLSGDVFVRSGGSATLELVATALLGEVPQFVGYLRLRESPWRMNLRRDRSFAPSQLL